jgi:hypothetical protein
MLPSRKGYSWIDRHKPLSFSQKSTFHKKAFFIGKQFAKRWYSTDEWPRIRQNIRYSSFLQPHIRNSEIKKNIFPRGEGLGNGDNLYIPKGPIHMVGKHYHQAYLGSDNSSWQDKSQLPGSGSPDSPNLKLYNPPCPGMV